MRARFMLVCCCAIISSNASEICVMKRVECTCIGRSVPFVISMCNIIRYKWVSIRGSVCFWSGRHEASSISKSFHYLGIDGSLWCSRAVFGSTCTEQDTLEWVCGHCIWKIERNFFVTSWKQIMAQWFKCQPVASFISPIILSSGRDSGSRSTVSNIDIRI